MNPNWQNIHKSFALNGISYTWGNLREVGYSLVKEGLDFEKPIGDFLLDWSSQKDTLEVYTSGSTGKPKRITLQKSKMVHSALATGQYFKLKSGDSALLCLPVNSIAGKMMLVRAMVLGLKLDYVVPSSRPLDETAKRYDFCAMVPLQAEKSIEQLIRIKTLILGGAPISYGLEEQLKNLPTSIHATYGMTETITHIAVRPISPKGEVDFQVLPSVEVSQDERNCLVIHAPQISDAPVITNDLVEIKSKQRFSWLGRKDNVINSGGVKLIPERIEAKLSPLFNNRFFVAGIPDETLGQKLILILEGVRVNEKTILESIKKMNTLNTFEVPKTIYSIDRFIETKAGKIQRQKTLNALKG